MQSELIVRTHHSSGGLKPARERESRHPSLGNEETIVPSLSSRQATALTVTIKRDAIGDYYLYVVTNVKTNEVYSRAGNAVGLGFGLKTFLTASDSSEVQSPLFFAHDAKLIAKLNRNLSKKKKGSRNRKRAKLDLARQHKRIEIRPCVLKLCTHLGTRMHQNWLNTGQGEQILPE